MARVSRRWPIVAAAAALIGWMLADRRPPVPYAEARSVVDRRCIQCHSERPTSRAFPIAPQGVMLDTAQQMKQYARRIDRRVAVERTMPLGNMSGMTDDERTVLSGWVRTGAQVP